MLPSWHAVYMMLVRISRSDTPHRLASSSNSGSPFASPASQLDAPPQIESMDRVQPVNTMCLKISVWPALRLLFHPAGSAHA